MERTPVLHVVEATTAGVKRHVLSVVSRLDSERFEVAVACPPVRSAAYGDTSFASDLAAHGVRTHLIEMKHTLHPLVDARAILSLARLLRRQRYEILHAHSSKAGLVARGAARLVGESAAVYTPNAFAFNRFPSGIRRRAYVLAERTLARWTDVIICSSDGERRLALEERIAPADKLVVIENAIDASEFRAAVDRAAQKAALGLAPEAPVVGAVGRLNRQKGFRYLVNAAPRIAERISDVQFAIVGDGECRGFLENEARALGVDDRTTFLGYRADIPQILAAFDVFALPCLYEAGVPFAILEAMAAGVPVVATRAPGLEALRHGETGLLVPLRASEPLAQAILSLLVDPDRGQSLAHRARRWVERDFAIAEKVGEIEGLYRQVLAEKAGPVRRPHGSMP